MSNDSAQNTLLASTAYWTASARGLENAREDALFHDPWAAALAGEVGQTWLAQRTPDKVLPMVLRTRYFDDFMQQVTQEHGIRQVVMLAAGLDTRAFRLPWPEGTRIFELDQPEVMTHKAQVLAAARAQPTYERHEAAADFRQPWKEALLQAGYGPETPAVWLLEGFLFYIPCEAVTQILDEVSSLAAPGSWLGFDIVNSSMLTHPLTHAWIEMQAVAGAPWIGTLDDPVEFLAARGWKAFLTQAGQPDANYGRWTLPVVPTSMPNFPHNWFVTAVKEG